MILPFIFMYKEVISGRKFQVSVAKRENRVRPAHKVLPVAVGAVVARSLAM